MKKVFVTILTLALCATTLVGCGSSADSTANYEAPASEADIPAGNDDVEEPAVYAYGVSDAPATNAGINNESCGLADVTGENDDFGRPDESECVPWDIESTEEIASDKSEIEGIIVLTLYPDNSGYLNVVIDAINPNTANTQNIFSLQILPIIATNEYGYFIPLDASRFGNLQDQFTPDFSKMAITRVATNNQSMHAGWLDKNGNFFDVTAALGEAEKSDFEDPVRYQAVGFTDDGRTFVYRKVDNYSNYAFETLGYYAVSVGNITAGSSWEMLPSDIYLHDDDSWRWLGDYRFSDKIDGPHFYADNGDRNNSCVVVDVESQTIANFIPGETRNNWGVVSSPDKQQVAFMSRSKSSQPNFAEVYTMDLSDSSTERITTIDYVEGARTMSIYSEYNGVDTFCTVIDWR